METIETSQMVTGREFYGSSKWVRTGLAARIDKYFRESFDLLILCGKN